MSDKPRRDTGSTGTGTGRSTGQAGNNRVATGSPNTSTGRNPNASSGTGRSAGNQSTGSGRPATSGRNQTTPVAQRSTPATGAGKTGGAANARNTTTPPARGAPTPAAGRGSNNARGRNQNAQSARGRQQPEERERDHVLRRPPTPATPRPVVRPRGPVALPPVMTVRELSEATGIGAADILKAMLKGGILANINQQIDYETAALIMADFGVETTEIVPERMAGIVENIKEVLKAQPPEEMRPRPPVVTIMGHVDHGKTKLLDAIRSTRVAEGEAGGITQHIGAYQVEVNHRKITFLDTPGHEAFTAMRARGAQVTDIVVLVVAADDGVKPQTEEAIAHVKAAGVPMIVAINKIDLPTANPDRIKQQLANVGVIVEEYGGNVPCVHVSARQKINIDGLLEMILLVADLEDLRANPNAPAVGTIIEAKLDKSRGPVATVLIQNGTLHLEDNVLVGCVAGKIKSMFSDSGKRLRNAEPSTPVEIVGLEGVPQAGDILQVMDDLVVAREIALQRQRQQRAEAMAATVRGTSLEELFGKVKQGQVKELNLILKADVQGSLDAIAHLIEQLNQSQQAVQTRIIHRGVGAITEGDVNLALASHAIIIGFNARPDPAARRHAEQHGVDIRFYNIIYQLQDDLKKAMAGMLAPTVKEVVEGYAEVRNTFRLPTREVVAGVYVTDGKVTRTGQNVRVLRRGVVIHDGKISSLKRFKDDVREVTAGYECGLIVEGFNDIEIGDALEFYRQETVAASL
ncbi:translation initiation factor IF-2 [Chloroflexus sp. MS-G]|jgi:translation initiation factor IF-2|uniref:translation initiation factor IF-2 n=1 Tax=Chloroflexus sp. MS-G TaxID=1521187 RepID=UPI0004DF07F7|nr:translation initiation factor IF-2 [Chloroflexus sp. MS-G]MBO9348027.1 translation initiation factor IF-2 [Chloroflexus sp.]